MGKDHSSIIRAILEQLAESYGDNINRSAAVASDNTVSLLDKFQIIAKAFIWIKQADKDFEQERMIFWKILHKVWKTYPYMGNPQINFVSCSCSFHQLVFSYTQQFIII